MRLRFDDRLEKYLFFFVIIWYLIIVSAWVIYAMAVGEIDLGFTSSCLFFEIIPLIITYMIPWEEEKDTKFDRREAKIAIIYLGVLILWCLLALRLKIYYPRGLPVASFHPVRALYWFGWFGFLFSVFLLVMIRKQSLKTIGITPRNLGSSMVLVIIPFAYLLYAIFTSSISPASLMALAFEFLIVGIVEEFLFRGFPLFRLEHLGRGMAVLITGVLFAAIHGITFPFVLLSGLAYGLIFSKTRNILPLILIHMFTDIVASL